MNTSHPTVCDHAIKNKAVHHAAIRDTEIFFKLAIENLVCAAGLFRHTCNQRKAFDEWVSPEVSLLLDHLRIIEHRTKAGLNPNVGSAAFRSLRTIFSRPVILAVGRARF